MKALHQRFEFNFSSISLSPYAGDNGTSSQLLKDVLQKLREPDFPSIDRVIDRHQNRKNTVSRKLVMISNRFEDKGQRCYGKIALIKNKAPLLWGGKSVVEEIEKAKNKEFIEVTHYSINFNTKSSPVIMYEFNSEGPRLSDIEFYIRQIAKNHRLAKNINTSLHLKASYDQLDKQLSNIFGLTVKVNSSNNNKCGWLKMLKGLNDDAGYRDVKLELLYNRVKDNKGQFIKNIRGTSFARSIIEWLKKDTRNIEYIDDLKMSYQVGNSAEVIDLDFLKNKVVSIIDVPISDGGTYTNTNLRQEIKDEFDYYLTTGLTHN